MRVWLELQDDRVLGASQQLGGRALAAGCGLGEGQRGLSGGPGGACVGVLLKHQGLPSSCCHAPGLLHLLSDLVPPCGLLLTFPFKGFTESKMNNTNHLLYKKKQFTPF